MTYNETVEQIREVMAKEHPTVFLNHAYQRCKILLQRIDELKAQLDALMEEEK